jgi:hypothetical protein
MFVVARDIVAGEELTVECSDDDFDGGAYFLTQYDMKEDSRVVVCLDNLLEVQEASTIPNIVGKGLFAKQTSIIKGTTLLSTPVVVAMHRDELDRTKEEYHHYPTSNTDDDIDGDDRPTKHQLLLNYAFGHPNCYSCPAMALSSRATSTIHR